MNKNIDEKEETKVTKQEEYNQILELFGEKAEEIDLNDVQSIYIRKNPFTDNLKRVENITDEELIKILEREIYTKNRKHEFNDYKKHNEKREERIMSSIGG